jgi:hypothetical protein
MLPVGTGNQQTTNRQPPRVSGQSIRYRYHTTCVPVPKLVHQVNSTYNKRESWVSRYRYRTGTLPVPKTRLVHQVNSTYRYNKRESRVGRYRYRTGTLPVPKTVRYRYQKLGLFTGSIVPICNKPAPASLGSVDTGTVPVRFVTVPSCFLNLR